jgi:starch synthase (maltosyl-transferring)
VPAAKRPPTVAEKGAAKSAVRERVTSTTGSRGLKSGPPPSRILIADVTPNVDGGLFPVKRVVGDTVRVEADILRDGHEVLRAVVRYRRTGARKWNEAPMERFDRHLGGDRWAGEFTVTEQGRYEFTVQSWVDHWASYRDELQRKFAFGQPDLKSELAEGAQILESLGAKAKGATKQLVDHALKTLRDDKAPQEAKVDAALGEELDAAVEACIERAEETSFAPHLLLEVDRVLAQFGSWYELFPRSFGGFAGVEQQIPRLAELGFDILYLPPIHPIGEKNRKGRNNALTAGKHDPGSPWAIGHHRHGGHDAVHPELGTIEEFDALVATAKRHGIEIALDFAVQCSADHPWLTEHPEWFHHRPDGTLKYAENPPKKYQDIYNVNWNCEDWQGLWNAVLDCLLHWVEHGVTVFRVDNPHTKPFAFWEWAIAEARKVNPDCIFLAEAFSRRKVMQTLAKIGFNQSYTYFTWKNSAWELREYVQELAHGPEREYFRPNFFANTPDILTEYLVHGGPAAFAVRAVLASTLSPTYGIYSGFEHFENVPREPGSEEYLDSEKYEIKQRALDGPLLPFIARLNTLRREHPALQRLDNVTFLGTESDALIAYAKRTGDDAVIVVANTDPDHAHEGTCIIPYELGLPPSFTVEDVVSGAVYEWRMGRNFVRLDPHHQVAHVFVVRSA